MSRDEEYGEIETEQSAGELVLDIDYAVDQIEVRDEPEELGPDDEAQMIENADLNNVLDEFVELFDSRDMEGVGALLVEGVEAGFLGEASRQGAVERLDGLFLRNPTLLMTRGDLGSEPIVAVWTFDFHVGEFDPIGYITFDLADSDEGLIQRISYIDEQIDAEDILGSFLSQFSGSHRFTTRGFRRVRLSTLILPTSETPFVHQLYLAWFLGSWIEPGVPQRDLWLYPGAAGCGMVDDEV